MIRRGHTMSIEKDLLQEIVLYLERLEMLRRL